MKKLFTELEHHDEGVKNILTRRENAYTADSAGATHRVAYATVKTKGVNKIIVGR